MSFDVFQMGSVIGPLVADHPPVRGEIRPRPVLRRLFPRSSPP